MPKPSGFRNRQSRNAKIIKRLNFTMVAWKKHGAKVFLCSIIKRGIPAARKRGRSVPMTILPHAVAAERIGLAMQKEILSINMMEQVVDLKLLELMKNAGMCTCGRCRADVRSIALNSLPPRYVATLAGEAMTQFELLTSQMQALVITEILMAIDKVSRNPRHDR